MNADNQFLSLFDKLIKGTQENVLQWEETAIESAFRLATRNGSIRIVKDVRYNEDDQSEYPYRSMYVYNDRGRVIEEYDILESDFEKFDKLYTMARKKANNTNAVIGGIIGDIDDAINPKRVPF